jgi:hypothetical protein
MDHQEAIELSAVERYLLGELSPLERDDFEEHYFSCHDCATDVRITAQFLDGARKELRPGRAQRHPDSAVRRPSVPPWLTALWRPAVLAPAMALLLLIVGYQNLVVYPHMTRYLTQLRQPAVLSAVSLISANSRAGGRLQVSSAANQPVLLVLDIPAEERYTSYVCELVTASGTVLWRVPVSSRQARDTVSIGVPAGVLQPGGYILVVKGLVGEGSATGVLSGNTGLSGGSGAGQDVDQRAGQRGGERPVDLARYPFTLQFP